MTKKTTERISAIRWLAILSLIGLFIGDFGLDMMAKPVPKEAYWVLLAIAAGINLVDLRKVLLRVAGVYESRMHNQAVMHDMQSMHNDPTGPIYDRPQLEDETRGAGDFTPPGSINVPPEDTR